MAEKLIFKVNDALVIGNILSLDFDNFNSYDVFTKCEEDSNKFLTSLWIQFNRLLSPNNLDRCPWAYIPQKMTYKKLIVTYFGSIKTRNGILHVAITYRKKGDIDRIHFLPSDEEIDMSMVNDFLLTSIDAAKSEMNNIQTYKFTCELFGFYEKQSSKLPLESYYSKNFQFESNGNESYLTTNAIGLDESDAFQNVMLKVQYLLDFLAIETNVLFQYGLKSLDKTEQLIDFRYKEYNSIFQDDIYKHEEYAEDGKFIDFISEIDNIIILSKVGIDFINYIFAVDNSNSNNLNQFLNGCMHFRKGLEEDYKFTSNVLEMNKHMVLESVKTGSNYQSIVNGSIASYLSSIETIAIICLKSEKCTTCGQTKYMINQRVSDFISKFLWEPYGKIYKKIYNLRSLYLHMGRSCTKNSYGYIRPLLDINTGTGSIDAGFISLGVEDTCTVFSLQHVREWTSYSLRNYYKSNIPLILFEIEN